MDRSYKNSPDTLLDWLKAIGIWACLACWGFGMFISFTNGACRDMDRPADQRLQLCERGQNLGGFLTTNIQKSNADQMRAIALAELGRQDEARTAFRQSWHRLRPGIGNDLGPGRREHIRRMQRRDTPQIARDIWRTEIYGK